MKLSGQDEAEDDGAENDRDPADAAPHARFPPFEVRTAAKRPDFKWF
jgi:hypothetical protein